MEDGRSGNRVVRIIRILPVVAGLLLLMGACTKGGCTCVSSSGQVVRKTRVLNVFNRIDLQDNVDLVITPDYVSRVEVEAGEKIIGGVTTEVVDGQLLIRNNNKCNWLRDYSKPIRVYVTSANLWQITYSGSGNVTAPDTLRMDSISVVVWGGCGTINLTMNVWQGSFSMNMGTTDIRLHGICAITSAYVHDYGLYDARDLKTGYTFITSSGSNDSYVRAVNYLEATINSIGNIYYKDEPKTIQVKINGSGKVLPL